MIYFDKCTTGTLQSWTIRPDSWIWLEILALTGTSHLSHVHVLHHFLPLSLPGDRPISYTSWHRWLLKGETGHRSLSLITLLPASSKDGVLSLLLSLLLCGLFAIGLLGVLGRGGFFLRRRRRGRPLIFNLRGGLGMPFFTGKY